MKNVSVFLSENFQFLDVKISIYLNRRVFVMPTQSLLFHYCISDAASDQDLLYLPFLKHQVT